MDKQKKSAKQTGNVGEDFAAHYLQQQGYTILKRQYRYGHGEIDIIAEKEDALVFVEVKTKKHGDFGDPITWVTRSKQRQIGKIAQAYLQAEGVKHDEIRFDVIALTWDKGTWKVEHIPNAFWL